MRARSRGFIAPIPAAIVVAVVVIAALVTAAVFGSCALAQTGFDRPGGDYASAPVLSGDPAVCAARCERDRGCRSWSFSYPSASGEPAMCWLKREVVPRTRANCCVSGVRGAGVAEPRIGDSEFSIDRMGGDYRSFDTPPDPRGRACAAACQAEPRCRAWTYQRAGYGSASARCYLKDQIRPPHQQQPCCISGVVR
jgi:hypothetical protein